MQTQGGLRNTRWMTITQLVLYGRLVTFDPARPVIDNGALHICADERITAVGRRSEAPPSDYEAAARRRQRELSGRSRHGKADRN